MNILNWLKHYIIIIWSVINRLIEFSPAIMISISIMLVTLILLQHIQYHIHEYGHVLKLKEAIYNDKEIKSDNITIQVIKFTNHFGLLTPKVKVYSDYFKILENNKQKPKYQNIIKNIAAAGHNYSKLISEYKLFWITCFSILISTIIFTIYTICYNNNHTTISFTLLFFITLTWIMYSASAYLFLCKGGYGSIEAVASDCFIYNYPNEFKYTTLQKDKKYLQKNHKILLDIRINLSDKENLKVDIISKDMFYKLYTKLFLIDG